jgi:hypothetical protein
MERTRSSVLAASAAGVDWKAPPESDLERDWIWVDIQFKTRVIDSVDTQKGTVYINLGISYFWTDPRLVGWQNADELPPTLWTPDIQVDNGLELRTEENSILLNNAKTGRITMRQTVIGTVNNPMQLQDFPFDSDKIIIIFSTASNWKNREGDTGGSASQRTYKLRPVRMKGEGTPERTIRISEDWKGRIDEWELRGVEYDFHPKVSPTKSIALSKVCVTYHCERKFDYYFWKAQLPLYFLTFLSMSAFEFDTLDLENRNATVATYFLASQAMLYVLQVISLFYQ